MRFRTFLIGGLAVVAGLAAALVAQQMIQEWRRKTEVKTSPVVVTTAEIPRGTVISPQQVEVKHWPKAYVPDGAISQTDEVVGRVSLAAHPAGHPLWTSELAGKDVKGGLAAIVPEGMRAFTILTPTVASGVAGFIVPGNRVDVYLTISCPNPFTVTLLQNLEILAVDQETDATGERKPDAKTLKSVTLLVTPEQAARLSLGQKKGDLQLALRNPRDAGSAGVNPITLADLELPPQLLALATGQPWPPVAEKEEPDKQAEPAPETQPATPAEAPTLTIRTMRGNHTGTVVWRRNP